MPALISRHRPSLASQSSVWYHQILPSPARPRPSPIIANTPLVGSAMGPSASSSPSRLTESLKIGQALPLICSILPAHAEEKPCVCGLSCLFYPWTSPPTPLTPPVTAPPCRSSNTPGWVLPQGLCSSSTCPRMLPTPDLLAQPHVFCDGASRRPHLALPLLLWLSLLSHNTHHLLTRYTSDLLTYACLLC